MIAIVRLSDCPIDAVADERMDPRLQLPPLRLVPKHLRGNAFPLRRIGYELVYDVIGVKRLDAEFVQVLRDKRLPARNPACEGDSHFLWAVSTL